MSTKRRRGRQTPAQPGGALAAAAHAHQPTPLPQWRWRTFPVYLAFSLGGFLGLYMGILAGNSTGFFFFASTFWALLLGLGFSRLSTRWIMSRNWAKRGRGRKG